LNIQVTGKVAIAVDEDAIEADKVLDQPIAPFIPDVSRLRERTMCVVITNAPYDSGRTASCPVFICCINS